LTIVPRTRRARAALAAAALAAGTLTPIALSQGSPATAATCSVRSFGVDQYPHASPVYIAGKIQAYNCSSSIKAWIDATDATDSGCVSILSIPSGSPHRTYRYQPRAYAWLPPYNQTHRWKKCTNAGAKTQTLVSQSTGGGGSW
jgi:hypothetical protein